jgi:cytochrome c oxidase assembly protein subunit 11
LSESKLASQEHKGGSEQAKKNAPLVAKLLIGVVLMFGFGYALVPLYDILCDITGLGGKAGNNTQISEQEIDSKAIDYSRTVTVEFVANNYMQGRWRFEPGEYKVEVHPGEFTETHFVAENLLKTEQSVRPSYNLAPAESSLYFQKIQCFCFTEQEFEGNEVKRMPVIFRIKPDLPKHISTITLAYQLNHLDK